MFVQICSILPNIYLFLACMCELPFRDETPVPGRERSWSAACNSINLFLLHAVSGAFLSGRWRMDWRRVLIGNGEMHRSFFSHHLILHFYIANCTFKPKHQQNYSILERGKTAIMKHPEFPEWYLYSDCKWRRDILTIWDWDEDKISSGVKKNTAAGAYQLSLLQCQTSAGERERGPAVNSDALRPTHCTAHPAQLGSSARPVNTWTHCAPSCCLFLAHSGLMPCWISIGM